MSQAYYNQTDVLKGRLLKFIANGVIPARWLYPKSVPPNDLHPVTSRLKLELVSHCWQYSHLLAYQLSSLENYPPSKLDVTMTVFFAEQDQKTSRLLSEFKQKKIKNVHWNWISLPPEELFRRSIGRNMAALNTSCDWIWFTDCDVVFHQNCLDSLAEALHGCTDILVYPNTEYRTKPLKKDHAILNHKSQSQLDIDPNDFTATPITRATGPLQITLAQVARTTGYCKDVKIYQKPATRWCKALEDRIFRWILGTQGTAKQIQGVYRIQHEDKGRYTDQQQTYSLLRSLSQKFKMKIWEIRNKKHNIHE